MPDEYVHIVESPSPEELLDGITEGRALCSFLATAGLPFLYNLAVNRTQFKVALTERISEGRARLGKPILHLSCHGSEEGIQLTEHRELGAIIEWESLSDLLRPIHEAVGGLAVCMSCCLGAHGKKMAHVLSPDRIPFGCLIGTSQEIGVVDAALAFAALYRCWQRGDVSNALEAMRIVSGVDAFTVSFGQATQAAYSQRFWNLLNQLAAKSNVPAVPPLPPLAEQKRPY